MPVCMLRSCQKDGFILNFSRYAWIGLNYSRPNRVYYWTDGSLATWLNWAPRNPQQRPNEDCVVIDNSWRLVDTFCTGNQFFDPAICQGLPAAGECQDYC